MAKLEGLKDNISNIQKRLAGQNNASTDDVKAQLNLLMQSIQILTGALTNRDKNDAFTQSVIKKLAKAVNELGREVKSRPDLTKSLNRIESDVKSIPREFPLPKDVVIPDNSESFKALQASIKNISFPKQKDTDLSPVLDAVFSVLEKVNQPVVIPKRQTKWLFKIERDEQDLITRVVVT